MPSTGYTGRMALSVANFPVLKVLHPDAFKTRVSVDRALLPGDGVDVPVVLDVARCHAKPRVLASCTSGQELIFSEMFVEMVHRMAAAAGADEMRIRFLDRSIASLPKAGAQQPVQPDKVLDGILGSLIRLFGRPAVEAALASCRA